ncbi:MAG: ROK family protein [Planctomycetes bacterium]|nr:ROK family protein [Planctomycetota bacterium]
MFLGIEIGGTKLQLGLGLGDGVITALWRGTVNRDEGGEGIRKQIVAAVPELLAKAQIDRGQLRGIGIGFGGPTDDKSQTVIKSHHVAGWDNFPLASWVSDLVDVPAVVCNDADTAGLGEALFGAGKGLSPIFYITVGTGIGGGLIIDGEIYRGVGKGATEIGHLLVNDLSGERLVILEETSAGWGIEATAARLRKERDWGAGLGDGPLTVKRLANAAHAGHAESRALLGLAVERLALGVRQMITLLCPRRVVIGGGVSLIGEDLFFEPIRRFQVEHGMGAFAGLTDIVPAALGEEVVIHGALALARKKSGG